jgi:hypothetical protein
MPTPWHPERLAHQQAGEYHQCQGQAGAMLRIMVKSGACDEHRYDLCARQPFSGTNCIADAALVLVG